MTEWLGLEGNSRIIKLQAPCRRQGCQPPSLILDQSWEFFLWLPLPPLKLFICFSSPSCCFELNFLHSIFESLYLSISPFSQLNQFFAGYICYMLVTYLCKCHCFILLRNAEFSMCFSYRLINVKQSNTFPFFQLPHMDSSARLIVARLSADSDDCLLNLIKHKKLSVSKCIFSLLQSFVLAVRCKFKHKY